MLLLIVLPFSPIEKSLSPHITLSEMLLAGNSITVNIEDKNLRPSSCPCHHDMSQPRCSEFQDVLRQQLPLDMRNPNYDTYPSWLHDPSFWYQVIVRPNNNLILKGGF